MNLDEALDKLAAEYDGLQELTDSYAGQPPAHVIDDLDRDLTSAAKKMLSEHPEFAGAEFLSKMVGQKVNREQAALRWVRTEPKVRRGALAHRLQRPLPEEISRGDRWVQEYREQAREGA